MPDSCLSVILFQNDEFVVGQMRNCELGKTPIRSNRNGTRSTNRPGTLERPCHLRGINIFHIHMKNIDEDPIIDVVSEYLSSVFQIRTQLCRYSVRCHDRISAMSVVQCLYGAQLRDT